jgi:hypothetical protein
MPFFARPSAAASTFAAAFGAATLAAGVLVHAAVQPPNPKDLTQGTWEMNLQKTKMCPNDAGVTNPPRGGGRVISDLGWGFIAVQQIGVDAEGNKTGEGRISYIQKYDGKKYPANVDRPSNEAIIWTLVNPHRVEFEHVNSAGTVTSSYVRTVTEDGQEMTQTTKRPDRDCVDQQVFDRRPDAPRQLLAK